MRKILLAAILALGTTPMAFATPVEMTAKQLDQVTAGVNVNVIQTIEITDLPDNVKLTITGTFTLALGLADVAAQSGVHCWR